jgi:hypothetical protein
MTYFIATLSGRRLYGPYEDHIHCRHVAKTLNADCKRALLIVRDDGQVMGRTYKDGGKAWGFSGRRGGVVDLLDEPLGIDEAAQ